MSFFLILLWYVWVLISGISLFAYIYPAYYLSELVSSFLPYLMVFHLVLFLFGVLYAVFFKRKGIHTQKFIIRNFILGLLNLFLGSMYLYVFLGVYGGEKLTLETEQLSGAGVSVLYANIFHENTNYSGLQKVIREYNADVIVFVEFAMHHEDVLSPFLLSSYPYQQRLVRSDELDTGTKVFSKHNFENISLQNIVYSRDLGYITLQYQGQKYHIYVAHTTSPISLDLFRIRNKQLFALQESISSALQGLSEDEHVLFMGDFNVTPWSPNYLEFPTELGLHNYTQDLFGAITWSLEYFPFLGAHIDHVYGTSLLSQLKIVDVGGSDHNGIFFKTKN